MDKKTLLAFVLSFVILVGWSLLFSPEPTKPPVKEEQGNAQKQTAQEVPRQQAPTSAINPSETPPQKIPSEEKLVEVETPLYKIVFSSLGPTIRSFKLKQYTETMDHNSPFIELVNMSNPRDSHIDIGFSRTAGPNSAILYDVQGGPIRLEPGSGPSELLFTASSEEGLIHKKRFRFNPSSYVIEVSAEAGNLSDKPVYGAFSASVRSLPPSSKASYYSYVGLVLMKDGKFEEVEVEKEAKSLSGEVQWLAYQDSYFISAAIPDKPIGGTFRGKKLESGILEGIFQGPETTIEPGKKAEAEFLFYLGPRELGILSQAGHNLDRVVDFGWTDIIAKPLLYLLRFVYGYVPNYGIAIILLTILVKILFWPLTHKSYKSMKEMQKLQPIMAKIRERHKGNKEEMNKELMGLYKTYKVNPMGGCLPMIIQIPVFFALFRILGSAIELRHAPFMLWINDLSAPDRLFNFPFEIPLMTPPSGIPVLTLLMGASMFIQQKMTPTPGDPSQAKIMMFLPIIFTFMFINFPSGLVLYWLVNNLLSIGQQYRIQKRSA
jgi:YidC/Oxa1 family membrane protein insertase